MENEGVSNNQFIMFNPTCSSLFFLCPFLINTFSRPSCCI